MCFCSVRKGSHRGTLCQCSCMLLVPFLSSSLLRTHLTGFKFGMPMPPPAVSFHLSDSGLICFFNVVLPMGIFLTPKRAALLWTVHLWLLLKRYLAPSMFKLSPVINSLVAFLVMFRQGPPLFKIRSIVGYLMFVIYPRWLYLSHRPPMWH